MTVKKDIALTIIVPPAGEKNGFYPPYGAMYIAGALRQNGYEAAIINVDTERLANSEVIKKIQGLNPEYIGFSGIVAPSYKYIKELSTALRRAFPDKIQILGGGLSSAADPVLRNTAVDIVVRGEGDVTIVELINCLKKKEGLRQVPGIHFKEGSSCIFTGSRRLIGKLDTLPYPAFDLVDMNSYLPDALEVVRYFTTAVTDKRVYDKRRKRKMMTIPTSRGCFGECGFCFRAYPGLRVHSMKYVFDLVEYCMEKFGVGFFTFGDECFAPSIARNWEFIEEYKRRKMDFIFRIFGMRVDTVNRDVLKAFKEIGCWMIEYGFESGSQKMLNVINKRVTVEQNVKAALWTKEAGIFTSPAIVLAMPGENQRTIEETISFLKSFDLGWKQYQWKYALPIPGSALYDYARLTGAIEDEDEYLASLAGEAQGGGTFLVNLTDEPDYLVARWDSRLKKELDDEYIRRKYKIPFVGRVMRLFETICLHCRRKDLASVLMRKIKRALISPVTRDQEASLGADSPRFGKKLRVTFEDFLKGMNCDVLNKEASLKNINRKMSEKGMLQPQGSGGIDG